MELDDLVQRMEGEALALSGFAWEILQDSEKWTLSYRRAMTAAMEMVPRPSNKPWYIRLAKRMREIQDRVCTSCLLDA